MADEGFAVPEADEVEVELDVAVPVLELDEVADAGRLERALSWAKTAVVPVTFVQEG